AGVDEIPKSTAGGVQRRVSTPTDGRQIADRVRCVHEELVRFLNGLSVVARIKLRERLLCHWIEMRIPKLLRGGRKLNVQFLVRLCIRNAGQKRSTQERK